MVVEMKMRSESLPPIIGVNPTDGQPILDPTKGGLRMSRDKIPFVQPNDEVTTVQFQIDSKRDHTSVHDVGEVR